MPSEQCSRNDSEASASSRIERNTLWMMSGLKTLSSKLPEAPPMVTATSLPITCAHTMVRASHWVGLTFPGMILLPGSFSGMRSSPRPARGPEASQRTSLAILVSEVASVLSAPLANTRGSWGRERLELVGRPLERQAGQRREPGRHALAEARGGVEPGADGRAADRELVEGGQGGADRGEAVVEHRHPARDFLPECQRRRVLEVRPADLDDIGEGARLRVQHVAESLARRNQ